MALDDGIGEAYDALGVLNWRFEWTRTLQISVFNRAITLAPSYSCAHVRIAPYFSHSREGAPKLSPRSRRSSNWTMVSVRL